MQKRGQGAIEFTILLGVVLVFFILFFGVINLNRGQKAKENRDKLLQNLALDVRDEINIASGASEGYYREFVLPERVLGADYTVNVTDAGYVYLTSERYAVAFKASNVSGILVKGTNVIQKKNGTVVLNA